MIPDFIGLFDTQVQRNDYFISFYAAGAWLYYLICNFSYISYHYCKENSLKANGELNEKYPGGVEAHKEKLGTEGHTIIQKGRKNIRYYVKDYENALFVLKQQL